MPAAIIPAPATATPAAPNMYGAAKTNTGEAAATAAAATAASPAPAVAAAAVAAAALPIPAPIEANAAEPPIPPILVAIPANVDDIIFLLSSLPSYDALIAALNLRNPLLTLEERPAFFLFAAIFIIKAPIPPRVL